MRNYPRTLPSAALLILLLSNLAWTVRAAPPAQERPPLRLQTIEGPALMDPGTTPPTSPAPEFLPYPVPGSKLVYQSYRDNNWEIYTALYDGTNEARLTTHNAADIHPRFNRGCTRIVFASSRSGNYEIWAMNWDGSDLAQLTSHGADDYLPAWSPDGTRIAFVSDRDGQADIFAMNADGSGLVKLTYDAEDDTQPAWSPDGSQIAFTSHRGGVYRIWVMDADGSGALQLSSQPYSESPTWSPDGSQIAFDADAEGDGFQELWLMNAAGSNQQMIYDPGSGQESAWAYGWSPDGRFVSFTHIYFSLPYWVGALVEAWDSTQPWLAYNLVAWGLEWNADWQSTDIWPPESHVLALPAESPGPFTVSWTGSDTGETGLYSYDLQVSADSGPWTDWLTATTATSDDYPGLGGHTYAFRSRARDNAQNLEAWPAGPDATTVVENRPPQTEMTPLPEYWRYSGIGLSWDGSDPGGSQFSFDVQSMDTATGVWTGWITGTTDPAAWFDGLYGHTYAFRVRGRDSAQNVEAWHSPDGDTQVTFYYWAISGTVRDNRDIPAPSALVTVTQGTMEPGYSADDGSYALHVAWSGPAYTLVCSKAGYGDLPPTNFSPTADVLFDYFLPPVVDAIADGGFESGALPPKWAAGGVITPGITTTLRHTGAAAAQLGCQEAPFSTPYRVSDQSGWPLDARLAVDGQGNAHVVWTIGDSTGFWRVYYAQRRADGTWTTLEQVSTEERSSGGPQVAASADGVAHVVWNADMSGDNADIFYASRDVTGTWSVPVNISVTPERSQWAQIALDESDGVHVLWGEPAWGGFYEVYHAQKTGSDPWSGAENVSRSGSASTAPQMAVTPAGVVHVAWEDMGASEIYYARRDTSGTWTTPQNTSHDSTWSQTPQIALGASDTVHLVWAGRVSGLQGLYYAWRQGDNSWSAPEGFFSSDNVWALGEPRMQADASGGLHVAIAEPNGESTGINYLYHPWPGGWSAPQVIFSGWSRALQIATYGQTTHIIFESIVPSGDAGLTYLRRDNAGFWSPPNTIPPRVQATAPQMAIEGARSVHVVWLDDTGYVNQVLYTRAAANDEAGSSLLSQAVTVPLTPTAPTLSFLYRLQGATPETGSWLSLSVADGPTPTVLFSTTASTDDWTHRWVDLTPWASRTVTLTWDVHQEADRFCTWGYLDEVSLGPAYPDLWVRKSGGATALPGDPLVYRLSYGNRGAVMAAGVVLTDTLPAEVAFITASVAPVTTTLPLRWEVGEVAAEAGPFHIVVTATVATAVPLGSTLTNTATIAGGAEAETANNIAASATFIGYRIYLPIVRR